MCPLASLSEGPGHAQAEDCDQISLNLIGPPAEGEDYQST